MNKADIEIAKTMAKIEAMKVEVEGMKAANAVAKYYSNVPPHKEGAFRFVAGKIKDLAGSLGAGAVEEQPPTPKLADASTAFSEILEIIADLDTAYIDFAQQDKAIADAFEQIKIIAEENI